MSIFNHFQYINLINDQNNALALAKDFLTNYENDFILQEYAGEVEIPEIKLSAYRL